MGKRLGILGGCLLSAGFGTAIGFGSGYLAAERDPRTAVEQEGTAPCGEAEGEEFDYPTFTDTGDEFMLLTARQEVPVYLLPNDIDHVVCTLRIGQKVLAGCHFESATLGDNSIEVTGEGTHGYAFMHGTVTEGSEDSFDIPAKELNKRDECVFVPPRA